MARTGKDGPVEIAFNAKCLSNVLNVLDTEGLNIELTKPLRPAVIRIGSNVTSLCGTQPCQ